MIIGQTKRPIETRFKKRIAEYRYGRLESFSIVQHMHSTGHNIKVKNLKLTKILTSIILRETGAYKNIT